MLIKGTVYDTAYRSLEDARIIVTNGPDAGQVATSNVRGEFALVGTFDDHTRFEASKAGFTAGTSKLDPFCERCNPQRSCPRLATHLRQRQFTATIPANARGHFQVQLSGAEFARVCRARTIT